MLAGAIIKPIGLNSRRCCQHHLPHHPVIPSAPIVLNQGNGRGGWPYGDTDLHLEPLLHGSHALQVRDACADVLIDGFLYDMV